MSPDKSLPIGLTSSSSGNDTAVIICNGPSLASVPNAWLDKYPTFGANRVFLKYNPDVLTTLDIKMVHNRQLADEMLGAFPLSKEVFLSTDAYNRMGEPDLPDNVTILPKWANVIDDDGNLIGAFSSDPMETLVSGGTVTYGMFQLARWKGFSKLLVVGLNHTFRDPRGDHFDSTYNSDVQIPYERENVVAGEFASEVGRWYWSEEGFRAKTDFFYGVANEIFRREGGQIINCTPDTTCDVFEIDDWRNY